LAKLTSPVTASDQTATLGQPMTWAGSIVGTPGYMSPEQMEGKTVDARSDIFSLGTVLYEMASGRRAFHEDSITATLSAILSKEPKPLEAAPPEFARIVGRCLRKDPERRFQHADDLRVALQELEEELQNVKPAGSPGNRRPIWLAPVAVLAVVALIGGARWFWPDRLAESVRATPLTTLPGWELLPLSRPTLLRLLSHGTAASRITMTFTFNRSRAATRCV
jgi:serine/threonine protein kinase